MAISSETRRGIAEDDPRNGGAIAFFQPQEVTAASAREALQRSMPRASFEEVEARVREFVARIAAKPVNPPPPLSQPLEAVSNPFYELGTHPDIVSQLWKLDSSLPQSCRWILWGKPSLVHPESGVIFAVGFGTIGIVMRLPPDVLAQTAPELVLRKTKRNPGQAFDIGPIGPEWRFVRPPAPASDWCLAAYRFAGSAA